MEIRDPKEKPLSSRSSSRSSSRRPNSSTRQSTPSIRSSSSRSEGSDFGDQRNRGRVVEKDFDPMTRNLAKATKAHFRFLAVYDTPFLPTGSGRVGYCWAAIKNMVKESGNSSWINSLKLATNTTMERQKDLITFVCSHLMRVDVRHNF